ncbi:hypothetical protein DFH09DRAFT_1094439 [Mycena vulgaris]|nr:hypothetical protein DFH09DRAFT_1094439 [Mycena vulgaris]
MCVRHGGPLRLFIVVLVMLMLRASPALLVAGVRSIAVLANDVATTGPSGSTAPAAHGRGGARRSARAVEADTEDSTRLRAAARHSCRRTNTPGWIWALGVRGGGLDTISPPLEVKDEWGIPRHGAACSGAHRAAIARAWRGKGVEVEETQELAVAGVCDLMCSTSVSGGLLRMDCDDARSERAVREIAVAVYVCTLEAEPEGGVALVKEERADSAVTRRLDHEAVT